ncbi:MAG: hypothetical protein BRC24_00305 [Parcubacteria group bacterium SW_4_46_8]|nr:MAG: hypothetical protein BRC24_00305 [Parcubacteria group bacterium SW_4_46_8]
MRQFALFTSILLFATPIITFGQQTPRKNDHRYDDRYSCWQIPDPDVRNLQEQRRVEFLAVGKIIAVNTCRFSSVRFVYISSGHKRGGSRQTVNILLLSNPARPMQGNRRSVGSITERYRLEFDEALIISSGPQSLRVLVRGFYEGIVIHSSLSFGVPIGAPFFI